MEAVWGITIAHGMPDLFLSGGKKPSAASIGMNSVMRQQTKTWLPESSAFQLCCTTTPVLNGSMASWLSHLGVVGAIVQPIWKGPDVGSETTLRVLLSHRLLPASCFLLGIGEPGAFPTSQATSSTRVLLLWLIIRCMAGNQAHCFFTVNTLQGWLINLLAWPPLSRPLERSKTWYNMQTFRLLWKDSEGSMTYGSNPCMLALHCNPTLRFLGNKSSRIHLGLLPCQCTHSFIFSLLLLLLFISPGKGAI